MVDGCVDDKLQGVVVNAYFKTAVRGAVTKNENKFAKKKRTAPSAIVSLSTYNLSDA